jgi:hypothetical protein
MPARSIAQRQLMAIGYLAGFLDGEGYITIRRSNRYALKTVSYRLVIGFTSTELSVLEWIQQQFGGCINPKARKSERHSPAFELTIHNRESCELLLREVLPALRIKDKQADLALRFLGLGAMKKSGTWPRFQALPGEKEKRENLKSELTVLNRRGPCLQ